MEGVLLNKGEVVALFQERGFGEAVELIGNFLENYKTMRDGEVLYYEDDLIDYMNGGAYN
jgi:hypothetical protein